MAKLRPPKRRILKNRIPLSDDENLRFLTFVEKKGFKSPIEKFMAETGFYLRGRCDGPKRTGTEPCGYVFISNDSFEKGHAPILFFDPMPKDTSLKISFRPWKGNLPFSKAEWLNLDADDRLQRNMRVIELTSDIKLDRAIYFTKKAKETFEKIFDLSIDLMSS